MTSLYLIVSLIVSSIFLLFWYKWNKRNKLLDSHGNRFDAASSVPKLGGLAFGLCTLITVAFHTQSLSVSGLDPLLFFLALVIILITGIFDDLVGFSPMLKLSGQILAAIFILTSNIYFDSFLVPTGTSLQLSWAGMFFSIIFLVLITNAFNFIDGLDGLATGVSLIIFSTFTYLAFLQNAMVFILINVALIGSLLAFLLFNIPPAKLYMGDSGSLFLGLLAGIEGIILFSNPPHQVQIFPLLLLLFFPLLDTVLAFFRRIYAHQSPFRADQKHIHHRLLSLGFSYGGTIWTILLVNIILSLLAILVYHFHNSFGLVIIVIITLLMVVIIIRMGYFNLYQRIAIINPAMNLNHFETDHPVPINIKRLWHKILLLLFDIFSTALALFITYFWKRGISNQISQDLHIDIPVVLFMTLFWLLLFFINNLYDMPWDISLFYKLVKVSRIIWFGIIVLGFITFDSRVGLSPSQLKTLIVYGSVLTMMVNGFRLILIFIEQKMKIFEYSPKNTLIVGSDENTRKLLLDFSEAPELLYNVQGVILKNRYQKEFNGYPVLGNYRDIPRVVEEHKIEELIIADKNKTEHDIFEILSYCSRSGLSIKIAPEIKHIFSIYHLEEIAGHELLKIFKPPLYYWQKAIKRLIDIVVSLGFLLVFSPVLVYLKILSWRTRGKSVEPKQYLGLLAKPYFANDYSTMFDKKINKMPSLFEKLPMFHLILLGKMSVVGPRPEPPEWYQKHELEIPFIYQRLLTKPGITGLAQIKYRAYASQKDFFERLKYDLYYYQNLSIFLDLRIILRSALLVFEEFTRLIEGRK